MELAEYIKNIRKENSLTQKEFSDKLGMSLSTIKKIETGELQLYLQNTFFLMKKL